MALRPVVLGLTLCDYVIEEARTKKISLIGSFSGLRGPGFPLLHPFSVYAALTDGLGEVTVDLVVMELERGEDLYRVRGTLHFADKLAEVNYHLRIKQFQFPRPGIYQFTLFLNGEWAAQRRLRVYQTEDLS
jgi:hypothetical protein